MRVARRVLPRSPHAAIDYERFKSFGVRPQCRIDFDCCPMQVGFERVDGTPSVILNGRVVQRALGLRLKSSRIASNSVKNGGYNTLRE